MKTYCEGSNVPAEVRQYLAQALGRCGSCGRTLKVAPGRLLRQHSIPGPSTASMDRTLETLWAYAEDEPATIERLAAEHGVRTRKRNGGLQVWEEASVLTAGGRLDMTGWRAAPETVPEMLAWLGY